jgi:tetratricopeptide (TPR) repeat protein
MEEADRFIEQAQDSKEPEIHLSITAAELARDRGDHDDAEQHYLRALELSRALYHRHDARIGEILVELIDIYEIQGRSGDVLTTQQEIAKIGRRYFFQLLAAAAQLKNR